HRQHVSVAAHRVVDVAQHAGDVLVGEQLLEARFDRAVQAARPLPQLRQERACAIEELPRRIERALQLLGERLELAERLGELRVQRNAVAERQAEAARRGGRADEPGDGEQLLWLERSLARRTAE